MSAKDALNKLSLRAAQRCGKPEMLNKIAILYCFAALAMTPDVA